MKLFNKLSTLFLVTIIAFSCVSLTTSNTAKAKTDYTSTIEQTIDGIISCEKTINNPSSNKPLDELSVLSNAKLTSAGTTDGDWLALGLGRYSYNDNYTAYLAVLSDYVKQKYLTSGLLDKAKATEWHRISLAINAVGGDATNFSTDKIGNPINLIADGTYNRGVVKPIGLQGINGWIWGLIALDAKRYPVPEYAFNKRDDFVLEILKAQNSDGGFALFTNDVPSDIDLTAMAIQALAPYVNSEKVYRYTSTHIKIDGEFASFNKTVHQVIDEAINFLASSQQNDGNFISYGFATCESTCQVIVALTSIGINPLTDSRFIKNGKTLLDVMLEFKTKDGGFTHSFVDDPDNLNAVAGKYNSMATNQALYTLVALWRNANNMRSLYDMREEFTLETSNLISSVINKISTLTEQSDLTDIVSAVDLYKQLAENDRCYITNYWHLSSIVKANNLTSILPTESPDYGNVDNGGSNVILHFSEKNKQTVDNLPSIDKIDTSFYSVVVELKYIIDHSDTTADGYSEYKIKLDKYFNQIQQIRSIISKLQEDIKQNLYPFENIGLDKRDMVYDIYHRYMALTEYDRTTISQTDIEGLLKSKTQVDNLYTATIVSVCCSVAIVVLIVLVVYNIKKRKKQKLLKQMPESDE